MMEVKQNTAVELNDLLKSSKSNTLNVEDDVDMTDLSDRTTEDIVDCDLMKTNNETNFKINSVENGDITMSSLIKDVSVDVNTSVNSELEDALLEEDDVLPPIPSHKAIEQTSAADDILTEKAETSNSTTSSNNVRDPGDDLDTLLSKINDIVEDCIENESENTVSTIKGEQEINKIVETHQEKQLNGESAPEIEETNMINDSKLKRNEKSKLNVCIGGELEQFEVNVNISDKDVEISSIMPVIGQKLLNNKNEKVNNKKPINDEKAAPEAETKISNDNDVNTTENNVNQEKTEEINADRVLDYNITLNTNKVLDAHITAASTESVENGEIMNSTKPLECTEINKIVKSNQDSVDTLKKEPTQSIEKALHDETTNAVNMENDDSDDEIVFYVDKPPEVKKPKETERKTLDSEIVITTETEKSALELETSSTKNKKIQDDDDIVLLLDDDEEEVNQRKKQETKIKEVSKRSQTELKDCVDSFLGVTASAAAQEKDIVIDNSDNARDDFATEILNENEKLVDKTEVAEIPEETNSNCSSSSNLLQEAKSVKNSVDELNPEEAENEEDEEDGEVELIESELKDCETLDKLEDSDVAPPAKRLRLSEDGEEILQKRKASAGSEESLNIIEKKQDCQGDTEKEKSESASVYSALKRNHDILEVETEEKSNDSKQSNEINTKKQKTDTFNDDTAISGIVEEVKDDQPSEDIMYMQDDKKNIKAVPSYKPIRLYPAPKLDALKSALPMRLEFLRKFRKSFDNMTKQDLEELVLQKVVESIIHRSEFSEMRELIEKQEKIINAHRSKISELSKQFRDLEMVHNRVVKDIEQRNSQFIMPVKITRAVGLQVYIPNKKSLVEGASSTTGANVNVSPQRPVASQASSTSTSLTPPQRLLLPSQTDQQRPPGAAPSATGNSNVRRGCVQKITPIRPVPGATQQASNGSAAMAPTTYRNNPNHSVATQPRLLNKSAAITANAAAIQRPRYLSSNQEGQRMPTQQQICRTPNIQPTGQRLVANALAQSKSTSNVATSLQRRSESLPSQTANSSSSSIVDNYINTLTHLTGGNTAVSITPAKPKEKAVIDLTDEDEAPGQSVGSLPVTQIPGTQVPRRSVPPQNSSSSQLQFGRSAPSLGRVPPVNQMSNNKNRPMSSMQAQNKNSFASISTPPGTSITRINLAPSSTNAQRVKYGHPAPLPATPPQAFNPVWKLPPPRPTIRISNLDNGIVISWTMEESMDRHAECVSYQIYAYQETSGPPMVDSWRHVGDVKAMLLPMAVTLTQFQEGQRYYFAVRAVDCHQRYGPFSLPKTWS